MNLFGVIYLVSHIESGKCYVGQTTISLETRWKQHKTDNNGHCRLLHRAMKKHGIDRFSIREIHRVSESGNGKYDQARLDEAETYYIACYDSQRPQCGYNLRSGGARGKHSQETILRMKAAVRPMPSLACREAQKLAVTGREAPTKGKARAFRGKTNPNMARVFTEDTNRKRGDSVRAAWVRRKAEKEKHPNMARVWSAETLRKRGDAIRAACARRNAAKAGLNQAE